jgi:rare lipoprotein A
LVLNGCSYSPWRTDSVRRPPAAQPAEPAEPAEPVAANVPAPKSGGYYKDDGPGDNPPRDILTIPDPIPQWETPHRFANRKYVALGNEYVPDSGYRPYRAVGLASWYGRRFHGKPTASGEPYDMYGVTAAHPTLPIPSYARVTSLESGKSVIVRINDRGPFHKERLIDLSYTAAYKLGLVASGSGRVMVEAINPDEHAQTVTARENPAGEAAMVAVAAAMPANDALPPSSMGTSGKTAIYLQVGAFGRRDNALALVRRAETLLPDEKAKVVEEGGMFRVHLGPYQDADEAEQYRHMVHEYLGILPHKVLR